MIDTKHVKRLTRRYAMTDKAICEDNERVLTHPTCWTNGYIALLEQPPDRADYWASEHEALTDDSAALAVLSNFGPTDTRVWPVEIVHDINKNRDFTRIRFRDENGQDYWFNAGYVAAILRRIHSKLHCVCYYITEEPTTSLIVWHKQRTIGALAALHDLNTSGWWTEWRFCNDDIPRKELISRERSAPIDLALVAQPALL